MRKSNTTRTILNAVRSALHVSHREGNDELLFQQAQALVIAQKDHIVELEKELVHVRLVERYGRRMVG